jgi:hypothetical protein
VVSGSCRDERRQQGSAQGDAGLQVQLIGTSQNILGEKAPAQAGAFFDSDYQRLVLFDAVIAALRSEQAEPCVV